MKKLLLLVVFATSGCLGQGLTFAGLAMSAYQIKQNFAKHDLSVAPAFKHKTPMLRLSYDFSGERRFKSPADFTMIVRRLNGNTVSERGGF